MPQHPRCSLLGLPTELRIAIFEFALAEEHVNLRHRQNSSYSPPIRWNGTALLAINAQTRREAKPIFLDNATFHIRNDCTEQDLQRWADTIGCENVYKLRALVFQCIGRCSMYGLQPDTDYCHRSATLTRGGCSRDADAFRLHGIDMCSNRAFGCLEMGRAAMEVLESDMISSHRRNEQRPNVSDLLKLFRIMTEDQSSSAA